MHILCIMGSPRKNGNTHDIVNSLISKISKNKIITTEYITLKDLHIQQCIGCYSCNSNGIETCPLKDDISKIHEKMRNADGLILAAPTYTENVPALTKLLFDRLNYLYHRPEFYGKVAVVASTVGFYGIKGALRQLSSIRDWGYNVVDELGIVPAQLGMKYKKTIEDRIDKRVDRTANKLIKALMAHKTSKFNFVEYAKFQAIKASSIATRYYTKADYKYYKDKDNYVNVKTPIYAKPFGLLIRNIIPLLLKKKFEEIKT